MAFAAANIWQDFKNNSQTRQGTLDDSSNETLLGPRLNDRVRHFANGYLERLDLGPANRATDERAKLLDLQWGRIEHDGALLQGLGFALENFAGVFGDNVTKLGETWKGESYDAFKASMDKVQRTIAAYGEYAKGTGEGLLNAASQLRVLFEEFAQESANNLLDFSDASPPEQWHRAGDEPYNGDKLAEVCPSSHGSIVDYNLNCLKNDDEQLGVINGRFVTERRWKIVEADPCEENAGRVLTMFRNMVDECDRAREDIRTKLDKFFTAVGATVGTVTDVYAAALGNVHELANKEVFSGLRIIGGTGGGAPVSGGDTGAATAGPYPGGGGGGPVSGGYPGGGGGAPVAVAEPMPPEPEVPVEETAPAEAVAPEPAEEAPADQQASVEIKDGDRTIGVTSPDGEGRVRVTVEDATGKTKTYELDFNAASGMAAQPAADGTGAAPDGEAPEQVPARTDGKCVIQDGPLTITAERPLFSPDSIQLTVDDGTGNPTSYTLDFDEEQDTAGPDGDQQSPATRSDTAASGTPGSAPRPASDQPAGETPAAAPVAEPEPAAAAQSVDTRGQTAPGATDAAPAPTDQSARPTGEPGQTHAAAANVTSQPGWLGDRESVSGVLVPDRPEGEAGEAALAAAPDDAQSEASGMAGAGMPMMGGGPAGGGSEPGRAGSGWSVHGDLFDSGEPVYSMHGVLGDDDQATEQP